MFPDLKGVIIIILIGDNFMRVDISNDIRIVSPPESIIQWTYKNLVRENPEYTSRVNMGRTTYKNVKGRWVPIPKEIRLFEETTTAGEYTLILPYGTWPFLKKTVEGHAIVRDMVSDHGEIDYEDVSLPLYDYQQEAVDVMVSAGSGILISDCGTGKTQMGIAAAVALKRKTLWLTHTADLLEQSYSRAAQYMPKEWLGKITAGKINIGSHITFATVQTLSRQDLSMFKYEWDVIIVDECHRVCGSADKIQMFYGILMSLCAKHKYGLTATLWRRDHLEVSVIAALGPPVHEVPSSVTRSKVINPAVIVRSTGAPASFDYFDKHGEIVYSKLVNYLCESESRNAVIIQDLLSNTGHYNLVLSDRVSHLNTLMEMLPEDIRAQSAVIDGSAQTKKAKALRQQVIDDMNAGKKRFLFATFNLAKEGLDIPRLDRAYFVSPHRDKAVIKQSLGRISRIFDGKDSALCYDYYDENISMLAKGIFPKRLEIYNDMDLKVTYA